MRNQGLNKEDTQYRKALENMRYKSCTKDDIRCLNNLVSANKPNRHYISLEPWRSAPIIIGENKQRDEINRLGAMRFANDTSQTLTLFYSEDCISSSSSAKSTTQSLKAVKKSKVNTMNKDLQKILWEQPPSTHEFHSPAVLPLCRGMPVIIRHNFATELNITKGQRGVVYSWMSKKGLFDHQYLQVLFVLLINPPSPIQIEGLPINVVPIVARENKGYITLPDDTKIYITRKQVDVLLGFAMTAYASQGQSLSDNATDLNTLNDHHAFYTALSRSRTYNNTIILQGFDHKYITGGASGALRKELRDLELLDEITRLRYEGKSDASVQGSTRSVLIESFRNWKGQKYNPPCIHSAIRWSDKDPYIVDDQDDVGWKIVAPSKKQTKGTQSSIHSNSNHTPALKRKLPVDETDFLPPCSIKKIKLTEDKPELGENICNMITSTPVKVLQWSNNSCAYDALILIIRQIWIETDFDITSYVHLPTIINGFGSHLHGRISLESVRDDFRRLVQHTNNDLRWGAYASSQDVLSELLRTHQSCFDATLTCPEGHNQTRTGRVPVATQFYPPFLTIPTSSSHWLNNIPPYAFNTCRSCNNTLVKQLKLITAPPIISFNIDGMLLFNIDTHITSTVMDDIVHYRLVGISYFSIEQAHFNSRIFARSGEVFVHDGMLNDGNMIMESTALDGMDLSINRGYKASALLYMRI
ncbi:hypothetical protein F5878DRAFT_536467 [Lentinula raphanica]|uniref:Uncharacterized protein n=1 Tax=Lentinula raphanica TaxID=153919 RepID=A0AA38UHY7_9AGAR|nr:hypothetical protein F5878DRAFT_536467 [Lentinula raphanica]